MLATPGSFRVIFYYVSLFAETRLSEAAVGIARRGSLRYYFPYEYTGYFTYSHFSIVAHQYLTKSTISDRILELTHTVERTRYGSQLLDTMDIERERGITIKSKRSPRHV